MNDEAAVNEEQGQEQESNDLADAMAAVAIVLIPVIGIIYWLSGM
ncbi:MAG: hypothetical protein O2868_10395 [Proteobacteria bacterium]|jgi:hypothetical protein|nr:hypothetical protein [Pseudomonadota bacterium]